MRKKKSPSKYSKVMLIDDNVIDNFINSKMIEGCNFSEHTYTHTNGKSALEFLKNIESVRKVSKTLAPQVIFLDINMPIMDGFWFIDEFDKLGKSIKSGCKIYLLTASLNPSDVEKSRKNRYVTGYISKPLSEKMLAEL